MTLPIIVEQDRVRIGERFAVSFQRTLRIPDDGRVYPLPPGLGRFPVHRVEDYRDRVPAEWREAGGVFIPMYQREALWLAFDAADWKPNAVKIGIGRINAVSGGAWDERLHADPQDYVVCPDQPWLDGINVGNGVIRQFVAVPLGQRDTVEGQLTGQEAFGGIQIVVFEPVPGRFPDQPPPRSAAYSLMEPAAAGMGLAAGGTMEQNIYPDPYGLETWDPQTFGAVWIHVLNSAQYQAITGREPLPTPVSARTYTEYGFPWFALYDEDRGDVPPSDRLAQVESLRDRYARRGVEDSADGSLDVPDSQVRRLGDPAHE